MAVHVVREPEVMMFAALQESCVLCKTQTRYWWGKGCTPLCPTCADKTTHQEMYTLSAALKFGPLPTKDTTRCGSPT